jgi:hypothetical protein
MMDSLDVRLDVVRRLQTQLLRSTGQSQESSAQREDILDHAIELALNGRREVLTVPFLYRNVIRDSRRIVKRRRERHPFEPFEDEMALECGGHGSRYPRQDEVAIADEFRERLQSYTLCVHAKGEECLAGLLAGETVEESSAATGLTPRQVRYAREGIREAARVLAAEDAT